MFTITTIQLYTAIYSMFTITPIQLYTAIYSMLTFTTINVYTAIYSTFTITPIHVYTELYIACSLLQPYHYTQLYIARSLLQPYKYTRFKSIIWSLTANWLQNTTNVNNSKSRKIRLVLVDCIYSFNSTKEHGYLDNNAKLLIRRWLKMLFRNLYFWY